MNTPKVTAIVPVYNTEEYVEQAIRSLMEQTLPDLEIVVVNDGSTDNSLQVIERLAAEDARIRIHSQPNKGLSEARNAGLALAHGEYIHFMDSDDLLEADAYELCCARCEADRLDFVIFDADCFGATVPEAFWYDYRRAQYIGDGVVTGYELLTRLLDAWRYRASACMSFIRRSYFDRAGLGFEPGILHEDELFTPKLYLGAERTGAIARDFFHRRVREDSIMGAGFSERSLEGYMTVVDGLNRYAAGRSKSDRRMISRLLRLILTPVMSHASALRPSVRWKLAWTLVRGFPGCIGAKQLFLLLFKAPLKKLRR